MKTAKMMAMVVALLVCVAVPASASVIQTGGNPLLFDGIKVEPSRVDAYQGFGHPVIEAVFDLGVPSQPVTGALITYYSAAVGGVFKPNPVDFYFSNTLGVFNAVPDVSFDTASWPEYNGWTIVTDAEATAAGSGQYLKIVANYSAPSTWVMLFEIQPVLGSTPQPVPEPATISLLALGGLALLRRRRNA